MLPSHQRFEPDGIACIKSHDRLKHHEELSPIYAGLNFLLEPQRFDGFAKVWRWVVWLGWKRSGRSTAGALEPRNRCPVALEHDAQAHAEDGVRSGNSPRQLLARDDDQDAVCQRSDGGRAFSSIQDRHLADDLAWPAARQHEIAIRARRKYFKAPLLDEVGGIARITLAEESDTGAEVHAMQ